MSNAPHFIRGARRGDEISYGDLSSILSHDGLKDAYDESMMGVTGETIAREADISREQSDAFAVRSHTLSNQAWDQGWFAEECLEIDGLSRDEGIRTDTSVESLAGLRTVFDK